MYRLWGYIILGSPPSIVSRIYVASLYLIPYRCLCLSKCKPPALQLQALWAELKAGLRGVVQEISSLQQSNIHLEEKVSECQRDTEEKILSLRNKLNTLQVHTL